MQTESWIQFEEPLALPVPARPTAPTELDGRRSHTAPLTAALIELEREQGREDMVWLALGAASLGLVAVSLWG